MALLKVSLGNFPVHSMSLDTWLRWWKLERIQGCKKGSCVREWRSKRSTILFDGSMSVNLMFREAWALVKASEPGTFRQVGQRLGDEPTTYVKWVST